MVEMAQQLVVAEFGKLGERRHLPAFKFAGGQRPFEGCTHQKELLTLRRQITHFA